MNCAIVFMLSIQLLTGPAVLSRPATVKLLTKNPAQGDRSDKFNTIAQNVPPETEQKSKPSAGPAQSPSSDLPSKRPASSADAASNPHKKSPSSHAPKQAKGRKTKTKPGKVVVRNGSTAEPTVQFSTAGSPEQTSHERQKTDGLLAATNSNLQKLTGRSLNSGQQDMLTQVRSYMQQAKSAEDAGDLQSAQSLALKANLLSSDLVGK